MKRIAGALLAALSSFGARRNSFALCIMHCALCIGLTATALADLPRPDPSVAEFARGVKFTVAGYTGSQVLTNFPVLVRLSESTIDGFHYSDFTRADYKDLCFVDMQTNGLPCEVDTWNPLGESLVWVTLPRMTNNAEFVMWYHSSSVGSLVCNANAWGDYGGVWHMNDSGDGAVTISDATANELHATATSGSYAQPDGRIGGARIPTKDGSGKTTERIEVNLNTTAKRTVVDNVNTAADHAFTVSMWIKPVKYSSFDGPNSAYLMSRKTADDQPYWAVQFHYDNRNGYKNSIHYGWIRTWRNEKGGDDCWHSEFDDSVIPLAASACYGNWYKLDVVYSKTNVYFYVNGGGAANSCLTNVTTKFPANGSNKLFLTGTSVGSKARPFRGDLDEFRLRAGAMSADWVKADFDTVDNSSFLSAGAVQTVKVREIPVASFSLLDSGAAFATFSGVISSLGEEEATSGDVYYKVWPSSGSEPTSPDDGWTLLRSGLTANVTFKESVTGLTPGTAYSWKLYAKNDLGDSTEEIAEGSFTTSGAGVAGVGGETYRVRDDYVHRFTVNEDTTSYEFTPPSYVTTLRALVVAGGGPGGYDRGGGGGAGGLVYNPTLALSGGTTYTINVGTGGVASASSTVYGSNGGDSAITNKATGMAVMTVIGGGAGGNYGTTNRRGVSGGSGGGSAYGSVGGEAAEGQGFAGGKGMPHEGFENGGGGGGASEVGGDATSAGATHAAGGGGAGFPTDISGENVYYAGGGGGGADVPTKGNKTGNGPGRGGDGGGGDGGSSTVAATAGQANLGGGGGGGYLNSIGGNGGNGIVILRYAVQGNGSNMPEPAVALTGATYNGEDFTADVTYRVAWAGSGQDRADVLIAWGYSADSLIHTNFAESAAIGIGSFSVPMIADQRTVFLRAIATNAVGYVGVSTETRSIYVEQNDNAQEDDSTPVLADVGIAIVDGAYVVVTGVVTSVGQSLETCEVRLLTGLTDNQLYVGAAGRYAKDGVFALTNSTLSASTTYYWQVQAVDDGGHGFATEPGTFTTLGASFLNAATPSSDQSVLTINGSLSVVGAGVTYVLFRWNGGEWQQIEAITRDSASASFSASFFIAEAWDQATDWEVMCSNVCVTAEGVPTGQFFTTVPSAATGTAGSFNHVDKAAYTWQAADGEWSGNWTNAAHWASDKADCRGYPIDENTAARFFDCPDGLPVVVMVDGQYAIGLFGPNATNNVASDITFRGAGSSSSGLTITTPVGYDRDQHVCSDTQIKFEDMAVTLKNHWPIMRSKRDDGRDVVCSNVLVRFSNVALSTVYQVKLCAPHSRLEFTDGTTATAKEVSVAGVNSVLLVDDSTVTVSECLRLSIQCIPNDGVHILFRGAAPKLTAQKWFSPYQLVGQPAGVVFEVPVGGYTSAPFVFSHASNTFGQPDATGKQATHTFEISRDSPALRQSNKPITNNVLIQTAKGFYSTVLTDSTFPVPERGGNPAGAFKWGVDGAPLADGADLSTAQQLLVDLQGWGSAFILIMN